MLQRQDEKPWSESTKSRVPGGALASARPTILVHPLVGLEDRVAVFGRQRRVVARMGRVEEPEHQVRDLVGELEVVHQHVPVAAVRQLVLEHLFVARHRHLDVLQEEGLVHVAFFDRPGVDRPADGLVEAVFADQLLGEAARGRQPEIRRQVLRVELDRGEVEADLRLERDQVETADAVQRHQRVVGELEMRPVAPLARLERRACCPIPRPSSTCGRRPPRASSAG